jgi:hypothetical protein
MVNKYMLAQHQGDYINDVSNIHDTDSFINFIKIAWDTDPLYMAVGAVLIMVVSIYIYSKTRSVTSKYIRNYIVKRM